MSNYLSRLTRKRDETNRIKTTRMAPNDRTLNDAKAQDQVRMPFNQQTQPAYPREQLPSLKSPKSSIKTEVLLIAVLVLLIAICITCLIELNKPKPNTKTEGCDPKDFPFINQKFCRVVSVLNIGGNFHQLNDQLANHA